MVSGPFDLIRRFVRRVEELFDSPIWDGHRCKAVLLTINPGLGMGSRQKILLTSTTHRTVWVWENGGWSFRSNHQSEWRPSMEQFLRSIKNLAACEDEWQYAWLELGPDGQPPLLVEVTEEEVVFD